jgi:DNA-binding NarL/FixJ family response regulator
MPVMDGRKTLEYLCATYPDIKVLILTMYNNDELFNYLIEKGANSFIPKEIGFALIVEVIYTVKKIGYHFANIDLKKIMAAKNPDKLNSASLDIILFTKRETEVIQLIYQGYTNKEISEKLSISQRTVDAHRNNMMQKANVRNTAGLIAFATKNNLISPRL